MVSKGPDPNMVISLNTIPLTPIFGAEIVDVDLSADIGPDLFSLIYQAFLDYQVLVFRQQSMSSADHVRFAQLFGEVQVHVMNQYHADGHPELYFLSNLDENGSPNGQHPDQGTLAWHTDGSWQRITGQATMIYSIEIPPCGGETEICDMYGAYDELDQTTRGYYETLHVMHSLDYSRSRNHAHEPLTEEQKRAVPPVEHPLVRTHPETGRRCVYLGDHAQNVVGMDYAEGQALVDEINDQLVKSERVYSHRWQPNEFMIWDNRCVLHRSRPFDTANDRRVVRRCTVLGEVPQLLKT
jgi:taurine dioxygenase